MVEPTGEFQSEEEQRAAQQFKDKMAALTPQGDGLSQTQQEDRVNPESYMTDSQIKASREREFNLGYKDQKEIQEVTKLQETLIPNPTWPDVLEYSGHILEGNINGHQIHLESKPVSSRHGAIEYSPTTNFSGTKDGAPITSEEARGLILYYIGIRKIQNYLEHLGNQAKKSLEN